MLKFIVALQLERAGIMCEGVNDSDITVLNPRFYRRAAFFGSLGAGDSYTDGDFMCRNLETFFELWMRRQQRIREEKLRASDEIAHRYDKSTSLPEWWIRLKPRLFGDEQSIEKSKRVGRYHYDIGNALYRAMLGPTMAYSCGYWTEDTKTLDEAQRNKYRLICLKLGFKRGMRVLEIGCGWGGFAAYAAENFGVTVVGVSISQEQINFAQTEYRTLYESGSIDLRFMDYREIPAKFPEKFDAVVSIGMFEHVGHSNDDDYMRIAWLALKPGGKFLLHTIIGKGGVDPFIWYRVFPGGILPLEHQIERAAKPYFVREHAENFGYDYYRTLMAWWENFNAAWPQLRRHGRYDERFYRMWEFYVKSCAVAFKVRYLQLNQYVFSKGGIEEGYQWNRPDLAAA